MYRINCWWTALLTLPFGIATLIAPGFVFAQFGMALDPVAQGVARGYGATALAVGFAALLLRGAEERPVQRGFLIAALVFNLAELAAQGMIWHDGLANGQILGTIGGHAIGAVLAGVGLTRLRRA